MIFQRNFLKYISPLLIAVILLTNTVSIYANDLLYTPNPNFNHVAVNNEVIRKEDEGFVKVKYLDAVKIAGSGTPGSTAEVFFGEQSYETIVDEYGNWFVLFSVMNLDIGSYPVEVRFNDLNEKEHFITLVVVEDETVDNSNSQEEVPEEEIEGSSPSFFVYAFSVILSFVLGWVFSFFYNKSAKNK